MNHVTWSHVLHDPAIIIIIIIEITGFQPVGLTHLCDKAVVGNTNNWIETYGAWLKPKMDKEKEGKRIRITIAPTHL